jgi:hypothetical protein
MKLSVSVVTTAVARKFGMFFLGLLGIALALSGFLRKWPYPNYDFADFTTRWAMGLTCIIVALVLYWRKR